MVGPPRPACNRMFAGPGGVCQRNSPLMVDDWRYFEQQQARPRLHRPPFARLRRAALLVRTARPPRRMISLTRDGRVKYRQSP